MFTHTDKTTEEPLHICEAESDARFAIAQANKALATLTTWQANDKFVPPSEETLKDIKWFSRFIQGQLENIVQPQFKTIDRPKE
jgi:hypothetical protein